MYIDTHAHLDSSAFSENELPDVIKRAEEAGVKFVISPGTDLASSRKAVDIADTFENVYFAAGIHCHEAGKVSDGDFEKIEQLLKHPKAVAVGEVGLDYHYDFSPRDIQKQVLRRFLDLSVKVRKPLILHCREAEEDLLEMLREYRGKLSGVVHCYTGSATDVLLFLDLGFYIGFTGVITFKNSGTIREAAAKVPFDRLLSETDAPYMAPIPHRGKRNEPAYVPLVVAKLAEIHGMPVEDIVTVLFKNASDCFFKLL